MRNDRLEAYRIGGDDRLEAYPTSKFIQPIGGPRRCGNDVAKDSTQGESVKT